MTAPSEPPAGRPVPLGSYRLPLPPDASFEERVDRNRSMLARALFTNTAVAVVGNGLSRSLGYPAWEDFVLGVLEGALARLRREPDGPAWAIRRLGGQVEALRASGRPQGVHLPAALGQALEILEAVGYLDVFHEYVRAAFGPQAAGEGFDPNPYDALVALPLRRFVTTNYDVEIERALVRAGKGAPADYGLAAAAERKVAELERSFTQVESSHHLLALFALARVDRARDMVFHCHGRWDDPASVVATEAQYRGWYLGIDPAAAAFRQSLELLLRSNPLLFVGYGLQEEDFLRALRMSVGVHSPGRPTRPVFALHPTSTGARFEDALDFYEQRYGLNLIPFEQPERDDPASWRAAYARALADLDREVVTWHEGWQEKPFFRSVQVPVHPPRAYFHHRVRSTHDTVLGRTSVEARLERLAREARSSRYKVLLGSGGTGKSWTAARLVERIGADYEGSFFWSSYYSDDAITGIEQLLEYVDPTGRFEGGRFARLARALEGRRFLLVFDGFERLLVPTETPEVGRPATAGVRSFFAALERSGHEGTVIFTTRLLPEPLRRLEESDDVVTIERLAADDLLECEYFEGCSRESLSALCSLLSGHVYALVLAGLYIRTNERSREEALRKLRERLSRDTPNSRNPRMIGLVLDALVERHGDLPARFLERLCLFMSPVPDSALEVCYQDARRHASTDSTLSLEELRDLLLERHLLFEIRNESGSGPEIAHTVHATVRSHVFHRYFGAAADALPNFTLPGFTSGTAAVHPGRSDKAPIIDGLLGQLERAGDAALARDDRTGAIELCRSSFGIVRSRMEAITAARWSRYDEYACRVLRLANFVRRVAPRTWRRADYRDIRHVTRPDAPLYADELAWLHNDIGLACCHEGQMADTFGHWEQGLVINRIVEPERNGGQHVVQSLLHLAHTFLEIGNLTAARLYLDDTRKQNSSLGDRDYELRILGYRGLISHLEGDRRAAERDYRDAIDGLQEEGQNPRALSWFLFHWANLKIVMKRLDEAYDDLMTSLSIADSRHHPDLVAFLRLGLGHWCRASKDYIQARASYELALSSARRLGIRRLEAEVQSELARLALDLGDHQTARHCATDSLALANELALGLRQTTGMFILGQALAHQGNRDLGLQYLRHARELATHQNYGSRKRDIEAQMGALGEPGSRAWTFQEPEGIRRG